MNFKIIKTLFCKEILDVLRDKKTVIMMLVLPVVFIPLLMMGSMAVITMISNSANSATYNVYVSVDKTDDPLIEKALDTKAKDNDYTFNFIHNDKITNPMKEIEEGKIDIYISAPDTPTTKETFVINYISSINSSSNACSLVEEALEDYKKSVTSSLIEDAGLDSEYITNPIAIDIQDGASEEEAFGSIIGGIIPFLLITSLLMGTMFPAIDVTAGERERGTLETLLTLPVKNVELIISKFLAVSTIGIITALLSSLSVGVMGVYFYQSISALGVVDSSFSLGRYLPGLFITLLCLIVFAFFISALTMCLCIFAKTFKEANNYITPIMLVVMIASYIGFIPTIELTNVIAAIPVANITLLIKDVFIMNFDPAAIAIVLFSNVAYSAISIWVLSKLYDSEAILFSEGNFGLSIFEKRSNIKKGGIPTPSDSIVVCAAVLLLMLYIGGVATLKYGIVGAFITQLIIVGIPVLVALYAKQDMKNTFSLHLPRLKNVVASIIIALGVLPLNLVFSSILQHIFPDSANAANNTMAEMFGDTSFVVALLIIGIVPAICEELLFRGYIFSSLKNKFKPATAIILVSSIFGLYHMSLIRFFITALLGAVLAYVVYKTNSILPAMIIHCLNNSISVILTYYPKQIEKAIPVLAKDSPDTATMCIMAIFGLVCLGIGYIIILKEYIKKAVS